MTINAVDQYRPLSERLKAVRRNHPRRWVPIGFVPRSARTRCIGLRGRYGEFGFQFRVGEDGRTIETYWHEPRRVR